MEGGGDEKKCYIGQRRIFMDFDWKMNRKEVWFDKIRIKIGHQAAWSLIAADGLLMDFRSRVMNKKSISLPLSIFLGIFLESVPDFLVWLLKCTIVLKQILMHIIMFDRNIVLFQGKEA